MKYTLILVIALLALAACQPTSTATDTTNDLVVDPVDTSDVDDKVQDIEDFMLHDKESGTYVRSEFSDLEVVHVWDGPEDPRGSGKIFPFIHEYSEEADTTFIICNIDKLVAVCDGKADFTLTEQNTEGCTIYEAYEDFLPPA